MCPNMHNITFSNLVDQLLKFTFTSQWLSLMTFTFINNSLVVCLSSPMGAKCDNFLKGHSVSQELACLF